MAKQKQDSKQQPSKETDFQKMVKEAKKDRGRVVFNKEKVNK
jgi:hypothetical protein